jgi:hypothetical protein
MRVERVTFSDDGSRAVVILAPDFMGRLFGERRLYVALEHALRETVLEHRRHINGQLTYVYEPVKTRVWRSAITHDELDEMVHGEMIKQALQATPMPNDDLESSIAIAALTAGPMEGSHT